MRRHSSTEWPHPEDSGDAAGVQSLHSATRFSERALAYAHSRPDYPDAFFDLLAERLSLAPGGIVLDAGSGTGILTRQFLERGHPVLAVEPNREMRAQAERALAPFAGFQSVVGTAEATGLPDNSAAMVVAGQAFHWFDAPAAAAELGRVLRPGGRAVLVWNVPRAGVQAFTDAYLAFVAEWGTDYHEVSSRHAAPSLLQAFFRGGEYEQCTLENAQHLDVEGWTGRIESSSYMPAAGHPRHADMRGALEALFQVHQRRGKVTIQYDTRVFWGEL